MISVEKLAREHNISENAIVNCIEYFFPSQYKLGFCGNIDFTNLVILDQKELIFPLNKKEENFLVSVVKHTIKYRSVPQ